MNYEKVLEAENKKIKKWYIALAISGVILFLLFVIPVHAETIEKKAEARIKNQQVTVILNSQDNFTFQVLPNQSFTIQNTYKTRFNITNSSFKINISDKTNYSIIKYLVDTRGQQDQESFRNFILQTAVPSQQKLDDLRANMTLAAENLATCHTTNTEQIRVLETKDAQINQSQTALLHCRNSENNLFALDAGMIIGIFAIIGFYVYMLRKASLPPKVRG